MMAGLCPAIIAQDDAAMPYGRDRQGKPVKPGDDGE
jgi:hypothetical protein